MSVYECLRVIWLNFIKISAELATGAQNSTQKSRFEDFFKIRKIGSEIFENFENVFWKMNHGDTYTAAEAFQCTMDVCQRGTGAGKV